MSAITEYVRVNWKDLPKSKFDDDEIVIVREVVNDDWGYGHHNYQGVGVGPDGNVFWCYSSGCSCSGNCGMDHNPDTKVLEVNERDFNIEGLDPENVDFAKLQVVYENY